LEKSAQNPYAIGIEPFSKPWKKGGKSL